MDPEKNNEHEASMSPQEVGSAPTEAPQENAPVASPVATAPERQSGSVGTIIGIVVLVIVLVVAGFWFWGTELNRQAEQVLNHDRMEMERAATEADADMRVILEAPDPHTESLLRTSGSDEIDDLDADLAETDLEMLDREMTDIEAMMEAE